MKQHIKAYERRVDSLKTALAAKYPNVSIDINHNTQSTEFSLCLPGKQPNEVLISTHLSGYTRIQTVLLEPSEVTHIDTLLREINHLNHCARSTKLVYCKHAGVYLEADLLFPDHLHYTFDQQVLLFLNDLLEEMCLFLDFIRSAALGEEYDSISDLDDDDWEAEETDNVAAAIKELLAGFEDIHKTTNDMIQKIDQIIEEENKWIEA